MRKWLFKKFIKPWILKQIGAKKADIIKAINEKIDVPKLDEKQEEKIINNLYDIVVYVITIVLG